MAGSSPSNGRSAEHSPVQVVVVGSLNMDLVVRVERLPRPGETIAGEHFSTIPGGKGANQAAAVARLGARSAMIGRVGDDAFGDQLRRSLVGFGVDVAHVAVTSECSSGVAVIGVERSGENAITIVAGANGSLTAADVEDVEEAIAGAAVLLVQLEVPLKTVAAAVALARRHGVATVLDPAPVPAGGLPAELFTVDVLSPNQSEAEQLTGIAAADLAGADRAARELLRRGAGRVVLKLGPEGALIVDGEGPSQHVAAFAADVVDTTAAGDAFTAAVAVGLAEGMPLVAAVRFGCAAGALATTVFGAQPAMPARHRVDALL